MYETGIPYLCRHPANVHRKLRGVSKPVLLEDITHRGWLWWLHDTTQIKNCVFSIADMASFCHGNFLWGRCRASSVKCCTVPSSRNEGPPSGRVEVPTVQMIVLSLSRDGGCRSGCIGIDKEAPRCGRMILIVRSYDGGSHL